MIICGNEDIQKIAPDLGPPAACLWGPPGAPGLTQGGVMAPRDKCSLLAKVARLRSAGLNHEET